MTIPVQHDDDDFYINTTLADAQATIAALTEALECALLEKPLPNGEYAHHAACNGDRRKPAGTVGVSCSCRVGRATIAALQAQVKECDAVIEKQVAILEEINKLDAERAAFVVDLKAQLTQRTAELEAARREVDVWKEKAELRGKEACAQRAELERVRGELVETKEVEAALSSKVAEYEVELNGDPQNFYGGGRTVGLRTLIAALPKVEGEIVAKAGYLKDKDRVYALFASDEVMNAHLALWQHRQGMEG